MGRSPGRCTVTLVAGRATAPAVVGRETPEEVDGRATPPAVEGRTTDDAVAGRLTAEAVAGLFTADEVAGAAQSGAHSTAVIQNKNKFFIKSSLYSIRRKSPLSNKMTPLSSAQTDKRSTE